MKKEEQFRDILKIKISNIMTTLVKNSEKTKILRTF